jgi:stage II sporulation protein AA (anti-sigma F factor antagonist)
MEIRRRREPRPGGAEVDVPFDLLRVAVSEPRPGVLLVAPAGEVDVATAAMLRDAALDAVKTGPRCVVVDLGELTFCGSTGLVVLLECRQAAETSGVGFGVVGGLPIVRRVLDITGLGPLLGHHDTLDEVLAAREQG